VLVVIVNYIKLFINKVFVNLPKKRQIPQIEKRQIFLIEKKVGFPNRIKGRSS
jgi:hypothetical protein